METRHMLTLGDFERGERIRLAAAAEQAALTLLSVKTREEASRWLSANEASALLLGTQDSSPSELAIEARAEARHARMPILALADDLSDLSFADAFSWGADDVVGLGRLRPLASRLRVLAHSEPQPSAEHRGIAVIAETDRNRRVLLGRVLRNANYHIKFAVSLDDTRQFAEDPEVSLVVLDAELDPNPQETITRCRATNQRANWVITCPPKELRRVRESLAELPRVCAADAFTPPENVLFLSNELSSSGFETRRQSPRILYGTTVAFRAKGHHEDDYGFTYNISETGVFIRTTAPPDQDTVWLELCPPRSGSRVRLVGEVAWRRRFGPSDHATVPPGFGVRIVDGAKSDIQEWRAGYQSLGQLVL